MQRLADNRLFVILTVIPSDAFPHIDHSRSVQVERSISPHPQTISKFNPAVLIGCALSLVERRGLAALMAKPVVSLIWLFNELINDTSSWPLRFASTLHKVRVIDPRDRSHLGTLTRVSFFFFLNFQRRSLGTFHKTLFCGGVSNQQSPRKV